MTHQTVIQEIAAISSGTLATMTGRRDHESLDFTQRIWLGIAQARLGPATRWQEHWEWLQDEASITELRKATCKGREDYVHLMQFMRIVRNTNPLIALDRSGEFKDPQPVPRDLREACREKGYYLWSDWYRPKDGNPPERRYRLLPIAGDHLPPRESGRLTEEDVRSLLTQPQQKVLLLLDPRLAHSIVSRGSALDVLVEHLQRTA